MIKSKGYFFHSKYWPTLDSLIEFFKGSFNTGAYQQFLAKFNCAPKTFTSEDMEDLKSLPDPIPQVFIPVANE